MKVVSQRLAKKIIISNRHIRLHIDAIQVYHLEFRTVTARQFEQNKRLYLMLRGIQDDLFDLKNEIKRQRKEQESDLSPKVFDVSSLYFSCQSKLDRLTSILFLL